MKKAISLFITLVLFLSTTGIALGICHCSKEKIQKVAAEAKKCCCIDKKAKGKCGETISLGKIKDSYQPSACTHLAEPKVTAVFFVLSSELFLSVENTVEKSLAYFPDDPVPDVSHSTSLVILHRSILV